MSSTYNTDATTVTRSSMRCNNHPRFAQNNKMENRRIQDKGKRKKTRNKRGQEKFYSKQNKQSERRRRSNESGTLLSPTEVGVFQSWCDTGTQIKTLGACGKVTCSGHWPSSVVVKACAKISIVLHLEYIMNQEFETAIYALVNQRWIWLLLQAGISF